MSRARAAKAVLALGGSQGIIIPSVRAGESKVRVITLEGSSSMYDPVSKLSSLIKENSKDIEVNILPSGTSGGKESYSAGEIDFILSSTDESKEKSTSPYKLSSENATTSENRQQIYFAQDPLIFVYKRNPNCTKTIKYIPYTLFSVDANMPDDEDNDSKYKGNRKDLIEVFEKGSGTFSGCDFTAYVREGGAVRSSLNKTFLQTPKDGSVDGLIDKSDFPEMKRKNAISKSNKQNDFQSKHNMKCFDNPWQEYCYFETKKDRSIKGVTLVENNWIAFEHWKRSAPEGSMTFFPYSFYESNKELFEDPNISTFIPVDPETVTDDNNFDSDSAPSDPNSNTFETSKRKKFVFKKKLYFQYKKDNSQSTIPLTGEQQNWTKNLLSNNNLLVTDSHLFAPNYCSDQDNECESTSKSKIPISKLFES